MQDDDYIKLTLLKVNGRDAVEVDILSSKQTLTSMIFSAMSNNNFFAEAVLSAMDNYYLYIDDFDKKASLN